MLECGVRDGDVVARIGVCGEPVFIGEAVGTGETVGIDEVVGAGVKDSFLNRNEQFFAHVFPIQYFAYRALSPPALRQYLQLLGFLPRRGHITTVLYRRGSSEGGGEELARLPLVFRYITSSAELSSSAVCLGLGVR